jgi:hypothetical protein
VTTGRESESDSLPPDGREWIAKTAVQLRDALANPEVRTRVVELLTGDRQAQRRRRLERNDGEKS